MRLRWKLVLGRNSDDLGQAVASYSALYDIYAAVRGLQYFSTSPLMHTSESLFRKGLENPLDMALAEICYKSKRPTEPASKIERSAYHMLARPLDRSGDIFILKKETKMVQCTSTL